MRRLATSALLVSLLLGTAPAALAQSLDTLAPLTRVRLSVVQFVPSTGEYRSWDALGGEMQVAADGTVLVPTLGTIPATASTPDQLAATIADRLQQKLGLVDRPDATVQIVAYPPIYLVGSVANPGQYTYLPGTTVLQALALGGGEFRGEGTGMGNTELIRLQGDMQRVSNEILRSIATIARLRAELAGDDTIRFPATLDRNQPGVDDLVKQEEAIFAARRNEVERQVASLNDLSDLYRSEVSMLGEKVKALDEQLAGTEKQLNDIKQLVSSGNATVSRQTDVERFIAGLRSDRLDNQLATMRAQQGLSEAQRNLAKLLDDRRTEVSAALQTEQSNFDSRQVSQATTMRLLSQATTTTQVAAASTGTAALSYSIVRQGKDGPMEIAATESTLLMPGDLLKVSAPLPQTGVNPYPTGPAALTAASLD